MLKKAVCIIVFGLIVAPVALMAQNAGKEKAAVASAVKWLHLVDQGEYAQSWKDSGTFFREHVSEQKWEQAAQGVRSPLGKLISRHLKMDEFKTTLPGAPNGQYVLMQFDTSFANKKSAVETVTTMLDKDGRWGVIGYFIR